MYMMFFFVCCLHASCLCFGFLLGLASEGRGEEGRRRRGGQNTRGEIPSNTKQESETERNIEQQSVFSTNLTFPQASITFSRSAAQDSDCDPDRAPNLGRKQRNSVVRFGLQNFGGSAKNNERLGGGGHAAGID